MDRPGINTTPDPSGDRFEEQYEIICDPIQPPTQQNTEFVVLVWSSAYTRHLAAVVCGTLGLPQCLVDDLLLLTCQKLLKMGFVHLATADIQNYLYKALLNNGRSIRRERRRREKTKELGADTVLTDTLDCRRVSSYEIPFRLSDGRLVTFSITEVRLAFSILKRKDVEAWTYVTLRKAGKALEEISREMELTYNYVRGTLRNRAKRLLRSILEKKIRD